jgi:hypothetical protein
VTVLASAGGKSPLPGHTLLRNLAGANHEAQVWSADEIRAKARRVARVLGEVVDRRGLVHGAS